MTDESPVVVTYRPAVVAFDMIETLMSLEPLRARLTEAGQPPHLLEAWYTRTLRDGMALSATGDYATFTDVAESSLRGLTSYSLVDRVISVGEVYRWKPATLVYLYAAEVMDVPAERMALVAAHDWDCHGAKRAGLTTGWVSRKSGGFGAIFAPPDVVGDNLTEVVDKLLALKPRSPG